MSYVDFVYEGHSYRAEEPSNSLDEQDRREENALFSRDVLEAIRKVRTDRVWGQESYVAGKVLAKFYNITPEEVVRSWVSHFGPGFCLEMEDRK